MRLWATSRISVSLLILIQIHIFIIQIHGFCIHRFSELLLVPRNGEQMQLRDGLVLLSVSKTTATSIDSVSKSNIEVLRQACRTRKIAKDEVIRCIDQLSNNSNRALKTTCNQENLEGKWELVFSSLIKDGYFPIQEIVDFCGYSLTSRIGWLPLGRITGASAVVQDNSESVYPLKVKFSPQKFTFGPLTINMPPKEPRTYSFVYIGEDLCVAKSSAGGVSLLTKFNAFGIPIQMLNRTPCQWHLIRALSTQRVTASAQSHRTHNMLQSRMIHVDVNQDYSAFLDLESRVVHHLIDSCNLSPTDESFVLLAVSGGMDSMAMLHIMARLKQTSFPKLQLGVVNFNHKLRPEADQEATFVQQWASAYKCQYFERSALSDIRINIGLEDTSRDSTRKTDDERLANKREYGIQEWARNWRRKESTGIIHSQKTQNQQLGVYLHSYVIATAHHSDDQVETMMLKLLRGVHISNLYPMKGRSDCGQFIRPLLALQKQEIQQYLESRNLSWFDDSSNSERKYTRNRVRLDVVPLLEEIAGGKQALQRRLFRLARQSDQVNKILTTLVSKFINDSNCVHLYEDKENLIINNTSSPSQIDISIKEFNSQEEIIQEKIIHTLLTEILALEDLDAIKIESICELGRKELILGSRSRSITLPSMWIATRIGRSILRISRATCKIAEGPQTTGEIVRQDEEEEIDYSSFTKTLVEDINIYYDKRIDVQFCDAVNSSVTVTANEIRSTFSPDNLGQQPMLTRMVVLSNIPLSSETEVVIRFAKDGDRFHPSWREKAIKVGDFLRGQKVPLHLRSEIPVIVLRSRIKSNSPDKVLSIPPFVGHFNNCGIDDIAHERIALETITLRITLQTIL